MNSRQRRRLLKATLRETKVEFVQMALIDSKAHKFTFDELTRAENAQQAAYWLRFQMRLWRGTYQQKRKYEDIFALAATAHPI